MRSTFPSTRNRAAMLDGPRGLLGLALGGIALGVGSAFQPLLMLAAMVGARLIAWMADRPVRGIYLVVVVVPLAVQMKRGMLTPVLRPAELLILVVLGVVGLRGSSGVAAGVVRWGRMTALDRAFGLIFTFGSLLPSVVMLFRGHSPSPDDTLKLLLPVKHYLIYRLVLATVQDDRKMLTVSRLMMMASIAVALIGVFQVVGVFGVRQFLATYYEFDPARLSAETVRATSTPVTSQALGTYLAVHAVLAAALLAQSSGRDRWRPLLVATLGLDVVGALATATLTALLAVLIGLGTLAVLMRQVPQVPRMLWLAGPVLFAAALILWPLFQERWAYQFTSAYAAGGVPVSWAGRISNIVDVFWPEIQRNWLFGVSPVLQPRLFGEDAWRGIENQILYLMYQGGVPYAAAYAVFMAVVLRTTRGFVARLSGPGLALARATFIAWFLMLVLGLFDPHFNLAVETEAAWTLLALAGGAAARAAGQANASVPIGTTVEVR